LKREYIAYFLVGSILLCGWFLLGTLESEAGVKGKCANCHTMHNSQGGASVEDAHPLLLNREGCLCCHANPDAPGAIDPDNNAPQVVYYSESGAEKDKMLAGGTYHFVNDSSTEDSGGKSCQKGHNVVGINDSAVDPTLGMKPPGGPDMDEAYGSEAIGLASDRLTCAGTFGCHGDRKIADPVASIKGGHHSSITESSRDGSDIANSYRMLLGVQGKVADEWEVGQTNQLLTWDDLKDNSTNVNIYKGIDLKGGEPHSTKYEPGEGGSINGLCGECHGNASQTMPNGFHNLAGIRSIMDDPNSSWIRHPTDVVMDEGEYLGYPNEPGNYSTEVPVGFNVDFGASNPLDSLQSNEKVVLCISCHRAHGSQYDDALRWDYDAMVGEDADYKNGCFRCHTKKNQ